MRIFKVEWFFKEGVVGELKGVMGELTVRYAFFVRELRGSYGGVNGS